MRTPVFSPPAGLLLVATLSILWGVNWPIMKVALNEIPPWTFRALAGPAGGLVLLLAARMRGISTAIPRRVWMAFAFVTLCNVTLWHLSYSIGLTHLTSGRAILIGYTMPLWASMLAVFVLGERITARRALALALGMGGIAVLLGSDIGAAATAPVGVAFMVFGAITWATGTVFLKRITWGVPILALTGWQLLLGSLPYVPGAILFEDANLGAISPAAALAVLYNVFVAISLGTYLWFRIVRLLPANVSAICTLMSPVIGVVAGNLALGEPLGGTELAALALVCSALVLALFERETQGAPRR
ncbi:MAG: DMT family transporter [Rhodospirillales bacterium]|nr:DMT family transporter [Rhodospirillales bacterium]MDP6803827.1 DMT family transporter [Rhodospirillales bacterium]